MFSLSLPIYIYIFSSKCIKGKAYKSSPTREFTRRVRAPDKYLTAGYLASSDLSRELRYPVRDTSN